MQMAGKALDSSIAEAIVIDWRIGEMSQREIADKHKVSKGTVSNLCKGVAQDAAAIVGVGIQYRQALSGHGGRMVGAIEEVVDERMRHIEFFNSAAVKNVTEAMAVRCEGQNDFKARADTIAKGREVVLGKAPDMAVQVNTTVEAAKPVLNVILNK